MNRVQVASELVKLAKELSKIAMTQYGDATVSLGSLVKKKFPKYPWEYDKGAKAWIIEGEDNVEKFWDDLNKKYGEESAGFLKNKVINELGKKFEGYPIIIDGQDTYFWIGLD